MSKDRATILDTLPKPVLIGIMLACLLGIYLSQDQLNTQRSQLSPTYIEPLQDAPPMLALATETLGGFRGIISSYLWLRANEMQLKKNYPEQMQLAKWITQIQPQVPAAWVNRSWNLAYNISRNYDDPETRWKYVYDAVEMIRDEGIRYNPQEPLVYEQLAYLFEHKIGHNLDDYHRYYKYRWMQSMESVLWESPAAGHAAKGVPDFDSLINPDPANTNLVARVQRLRREYKLDPREMKAIHMKYGLARKLTFNDKEKKWELKELRLDEDGKPIDCLDWRMPETQSLYWASLGIKRCSFTPGREQQLFRLEKKVYVGMMYTFQRGRMNYPSGEKIPDNFLGQFFDKTMMSSPNLAAAGSTHLAYVHIKNIGTAAVPDFPVVTTRGDNSVRMIRWILDSPPAPLYARFGGFTDNIDRWQYAEAMVPSFNTVRVGCLPAGSGAKAGDHPDNIPHGPGGREGQGFEFYNLNAITPETETSTWYFYAHSRNFSLDDPEMDEEFRVGLREAFQDDVDILAAQQMNMDRHAHQPKNWVDINVDGPGLALRKMVSDAIAAD